ncbi:hypothetical protein GGR57DRAFT_467020 [Xylariaceae sp. FL1272]|nr:hypothetical protein GGR57DRAFT_467020 [Xylariaceae sp. FL1272]
MRNVILADLPETRLRDREHGPTKKLVKMLDFGMAGPMEDSEGPLHTTAENIYAIARIMINLTMGEEPIYDTHTSLDPTQGNVEVMIVDGIEVWNQEGPFREGDKVTFPLRKFRALDSLSENFRRLVVRCLAIDWRQRPTLQVLLLQCRTGAGLWRGRVRGG